VSVKPIPVKLRTKVRELYLKWNEVDRFTTPIFFDEVVRLYPELVEAERNRLFREAISGWVRKLMQEAPSRQIVLPMKLADEELPFRIPIRPDGKRSGPANWTLFQDVTYAELDSHVETFEPRPRFNKTHIGLQHTRDLLKPKMARSHRDEPIGPVLIAMAEKESKGASGRKRA
jgi:hypothetical protein